jgi:hypothetical protein
MGTRDMVATAALLVLVTAFAVRAEVREHHINDELSLVMVENEAWQPEQFDAPIILHTALVDRAPTIDGLANEPAWENAAGMTVPLRHGSVKEATLKAAYTTEEVFLLVSWPDPTMDDQHHPWVWSAEEGRYIEGPQVEDSLLVSIEGGCDWSPSLLAGYVYDFDAWLWLAARSNPLGQALDADGSTQNHWVPTS